MPYGTPTHGRTDVDTRSEQPLPHLRRHNHQGHTVLRRPWVWHVATENAEADSVLWNDGTPNGRESGCFAALESTDATDVYIDLADKIIRNGFVLNPQQDEPMGVPLHDHEEQSTPDMWYPLRPTDVIINAIWDTPQASEYVDKKEGSGGNVDCDYYESNATVRQSVRDQITQRQGARRKGQTSDARGSP